MASDLSLSRRAWLWTGASGLVAIAAGCTTPEGGKAATSGAGAGGRPAGGPPDSEGGTSGGDAKGDANGGSGPPGKVGPVHGDLLTWLDPEATAIAYVRRVNELDLAAVGHLYAMPPRVTDLLERVDELDWSLSAMFPAEAPDPASLFAPETLAFRPGIGTGIYLVRKLLGPRKRLEELLGDRMIAGETDEIPMLKPRGAFGYRMGFMDDGIVAFIPAAEIGSGLSPLTAGRDLPASVVKTELTEMLEADPSVVVTAVAAGPMLHLDLDAQVARARIVLRRIKDGYDGEGALAMMLEDATPTAESLTARSAPLETDAMQALMKRVAFTASASVVDVRLQLSSDDVDQVRRDP